LGAKWARGHTSEGEQQVGEQSGGKGADTMRWSRWAGGAKTKKIQTNLIYARIGIHDSWIPLRTVPFNRSPMLYRLS
jgi:hypothetical protein